MIVTRFAPSPTGLLHLGGAFAALVAWGHARAAGGRALLRIEDIDQARCRPDWTQALVQDLSWLGLDWDGPVRVQSAHAGEAQACLDALAARGLAYPCFCTRADVAAAATAPHGPDGAAVYPGTCRPLSAAERRRRIAAGQPFALRLDMARALHDAPALWFVDATEGRVRCDPAAFGDVVLGRKDGVGSYHLCATHDDAVQGVTLVTRGRDLLAATHLQRLLQHLFGWPVPRYAHHAVLAGPDGRRLAKRDRAVTIRAMRESGLAPGDVRALALRDAGDGLPAHVRVRIADPGHLG